MRTVLILSLVALGPAVVAAPGARAYLDVTHEFTFSDLYNLTAPRGVSWVVAHNDLGTGEPLANFEVVYEQQVVTPVDYSATEIELLKAYVRQGGSLYLLGAPQYPIRKVFEAFGARLQAQEVPGPLQVADYLQQLGAPAEIVLPAGRAAACVVPPPGARVAVQGADGTAVVAECPFGAGRVLLEANAQPCWREPRSGDPRHREASRALTVALVESLLPESRRAAGTVAPGALSIVDCTNVVKVGDELAVYYPTTLAARARPLIEDIRKVCSLVRQWHPGAPAQGTLKVALLATGGGGYAGPGFVGLQTLGTLSDNLAVVGHEVTHTLTPPGLPSFVGEGWASYVGNRVGRELGSFAFDGKPELQWYADLVAGQERNGAKVDFSPDPVNGDPRFYASEVKVQWMIGALEGKYGPDFMSRVFAYRRVVAPHGAGSLVDELLDLFCLAAGEDLSGWYGSLGLTYHPVIDQAEARRALEGERRGLADYERLKDTALGADEWVRDWTLADNTAEVGNDLQQAWVADTADPPELLRRCGIRPYPPEARARGLLVMGTGVGQAPDAPRNTAKLQRTLAVPPDGRVRLCLGGLRAGVSPSAVDLYVDEVRVWHCEQPVQHRRFCYSLDLAPYAGKTVSLRVVLSGGWGAWSLIDYATVVAAER